MKPSAGVIYQEITKVFNVHCQWNLTCDMCMMTSVQGLSLEVRRKRMLLACSLPSPRCFFGGEDPSLVMKCSDDVSYLEQA